MKKSLSLLLVLILVLSLLAGCTKDTTTEKSNSTDETDAPLRSEVNKPLESLEDWQTLTSLPNRAGGENEKKDHTLMIYMVGSDLEQKYKLATTDMNEIKNSGVDLQKNNIVIYTGGAAAWHSNIPSEVNTIQELTLSGFETVAATENAVSTGEPGTLLDFLNFSVKNYPADEYSLIFWDHGMGSIYGFGADQLFENDGLTLQQIGLALENSAFKNQKLRFVGFDACLMATIETAATLAPYAKYMIASEETEPGEGWNYSSLKDINKDLPDFASSLLNDYKKAMTSNRFKPDYSLSCLDLSKTNSVISAMDNLFGYARESVINNDYSSVAQARIKAEAYGLEGVKDLSKSLDMIDLGHISSLLNDMYSKESKALTTAISNMVVNNVTNIDNTNGISVYFPHHNKSLATELGGMDLYLETESSNGYKDFLQVYVDMLVDGNLDTNWESNKPADTKQDGLYMEFSADEQKNIGRVYYNVLRANSDDTGYTPILSQYAVKIENDKVYVPADPNVVVINTDLDGHSGLFHVSRPTGESYISDLALFMVSEDVLTGGVEPIQIELRENGSSLEIATIISRSEADKNINFRSNISPDYWAQVGFLAYDYAPDTDSKTPLSYDKWEKKDGYTIYNYPYDENFTFSLEPLSQQEGKFFVQLCVEDTKGELVYSAWEPLGEKGNYTTKTVKTDKGTMTFNVYSDHATLVKYEGDDEVVNIPEKVEGKAVTIIGSDVARNTYSLSEVVLPQSVTRIEHSAFRGGVSKINLPKNLNYIGDYALAGYKGTQLTIPENTIYIGYHAFTGSSLEKVTLNSKLSFIAGNAFSASTKLTAIEISKNSTYKSVDGVLFTADGKTLVAYPAGGKAEYTVPNGVTTIGYGAFSNNWANLKKVTLPNGLETIDHLAFAYCDQLTDLVLPDSLKYIGHSAFGTDIGMPKGNGVSTIKIGKNVEFIGIDAFSAFNISSYEVDSANEFYSSSDNGCLLNVSSTQLIAVPFAATGTFEVPFGVCLLDWHCLQDCNSITELIIPDTVVSIDIGAGLPVGLQRAEIGKGLAYWGNQAEFDSVPEVEISPDNPFFN